MADADARLPRQAAGAGRARLTPLRARSTPRQQRRLHEVQVGALDHHHHGAQPDEQEQRVLRPSAHRAPPSSTRPTMVATTVATTNVAGPNRIANGRPTRPACIADSLRSTAGP